MINRIESIANSICKKLIDQPKIKEKHNIEKIKKDIQADLQEYRRNPEDPYEYQLICELLYLSCCYNLLHEMHALLELNLYGDINKTTVWPRVQIHYGETLLGLASYFGHMEIVKYLVEVRLADVNAEDKEKNTALHQVVYGDATHHYQNEQDKIAKYLLRHGADIHRKNKDYDSPYSIALSLAPQGLEKYGLIHRSLLVDADKVRPLFENIERYGKRVTFLHKPTSFEEFCLEHAIRKFVKKGTFGYGFQNLEELCKKITTIDDTTAKEIHLTLMTQTPAPYSFHLRLIADQLPQITTKSSFSGVAATFITYYATKSILLSLSGGVSMGLAAWSLLSNHAYRNKVDKRTQMESRLNILNKYDRFFSKPRMLTNVQIEESSEYKKPPGKLNLSQGAHHG